MKIYRLMSSRTAFLSISLAALFGCTVPGASLNKAIRTNNLGAVQQQISAGIDLNSYGQLYSTPLITAVHHHNTRVVKLLMDNGADPNMSDRDDREPLKEAVRLRDYGMVKLLLNGGADPAQGKCDALYTAIEITHDDKMVELLVQNGGDLQKLHAYDAVAYKDAADLFVELPTRNTATMSSSVVISGNVLFVAINKGYYDISRVLLESGVDVNEVDSNGRTPLILAVINNQKAITRLLLDEYTPDLSSNNQGVNALEYAKRHHLNDIVNMLNRAIKASKLHT